METIKHFINVIAEPKFLFSIVFISYLIIFPSIKFFQNIHDALGIDRLWTKKGGVGIFTFLILNSYKLRLRIIIHTMFYISIRMSIIIIIIIIKVLIIIIFYY